MSLVPRVSVIMCAYDAAGTIASAIESLIPQSMPQFELIVIDDGSRDSTTQVVEQFKDHRVHLIRLARNAGRSAARNRGLEAARGEYIAIADADDVLFPNCLAIHHDFLDRNVDSVLVSSAVRPFKSEVEQSASVIAPRTSPSEIDRAIRRGRMPVVHPTCMFRRSWVEALGGYAEEMRWAEDFDLILRGYRYGWYAGLPEVQGLYRYATPNWPYWRNNERWRRAAVRRGRTEEVKLDRWRAPEDALRYVAKKLFRQW